jgi:hypothetical protein
VAELRDQKNDCFLTIFTTHLATQKPQNYHVQPPRFRKNPSKNAIPGNPPPRNFFWYVFAP